MIMTTPRKRRRASRESEPGALILHLPESKSPGGRDISLTGGVLILAALAFYLAARLPAPAAPVEETLEMMDEAPPPKPAEVIKEPPKPPEPPPERAPPPLAKVEAPPPVFGLREDEASEDGDMASATGNTLAVKADSLVRAAPPPLAAAPVELDRPPGFLKQIMAGYPEWAQDQGVEAKVLVWVTIDAVGRVTEASVKRGAGKDFDAGALKAARASLFQPLVRNGAKVPSRFVVAYDFRLDG
jgi:TonB family protein